MPFHDTKHRVRDVAVRLNRAGAGEPLLFLHGAAGVPAWGALFERLAQRFDLWVPEHPGFGLSDNPPWMRSIADLAMYYLDFIDTMHVSRVHLVGHSLGGWTAAELAVRNATKLASLSLVAPAGLRIKGAPSGDLFIWSPEELARNSYHDPALAERDLAQTPTEEEADLRLTNSFMAAKLGWEPRWHNPALERWLHRVTPRTLIVWGREDKIFPVDYAKAWRERIPDARVEIIAECGHRPHIEKPQALAEKILAFTQGGAR